MAYLKEIHIDFMLGMGTGLIGSTGQATRKTWMSIPGSQSNYLLPAMNWYLLMIYLVRTELKLTRPFFFFFSVVVVKVSTQLAYNSTETD